MLARRHTQQTLSWFTDLFRRGLLELDPPYQRRSVWNQTFKDYFIDTLLLGYPAPALFLYEDIASDGVARYFVVDGKQRLMTIFEFVDGTFPVNEESPVVEARGLYFDQLADAQKAEFWTYEMAVEYLPSVEESILKDVFDRINRNVARLSRQELRHARFSGPFISTAEDLSDWMADTLPKDVPRLTPGSRKQMKDVELVTQLLLLIESGPSTFSQDDLDHATSQRDASWPDEAETVAAFRNATAAVSELLAADAAVGEWGHRLRNQADFYSFFGAVHQLLDEEIGLLPAGQAMDRVERFLSTVNDAGGRDDVEDARRYYQAARSNSNGGTERRTRIAIISELLSPA